LVARVRWSDGCANSFGFRAGEHLATLSSERYHEWHELTSKLPWDLPAGPLDVDLLNLETGVALDWWELRRDAPITGR
jgi:hypothetical protein